MLIYFVNEVCNVAVSIGFDGLGELCLFFSFKANQLVDS